MKKILFVANITEHIDCFHIPYMKWFQSRGWEVVAVTNGEPPEGGYDRFYNVGIERSPIHLIRNIKATLAIRRIIEREKIDIVYCHTPLGAVTARFAAKKERKKRGIRVIYMAHGFHFYKNAPIANWLLFYPAEKYLAKVTDAIITINQEDYDLAWKRFRSQSTAVYKVNGVGVLMDRFSVPTDEQKEQLHREYGYERKYVLFYAAEFIPRKNHRFIINAAKKLAESCPDLKIVFAGQGPDMERIRRAAEESGLSETVDFIGYRKDMPQLLKMCDVLISSSVQEGLAISIVEGMASGLPILCSNVRGNREMVSVNENGYLFELDDPDAFCAAAVKLHDPAVRKQFGQRSKELSEQFSLEHSLCSVQSIMEQYM